MKNKEILIEANNAVAAGDYEGFLMFCAEDTKWTFVGDTMLVGKEAVRQWMAANYIEPPKFDVKKFDKYLIDHKILGPLSIGDDQLLFAVTEKRTKDELDYFVEKVVDFK